MPRAPKDCSEPNCFNLVRDGGRKCIELHRVAWANKGPDPRRKDTKAHRTFKQNILGRDKHTCQLKYPGLCVEGATQVDRIDNRRDYTYDNCQAVCVPCHRRKSSIEGHEARGHNV